MFYFIYIFFEDFSDSTIFLYDILKNFNIYYDKMTAKPNPSRGGDGKPRVWYLARQPGCRLSE